MRVAFLLAVLLLAAGCTTPVTDPVVLPPSDPGDDRLAATLHPLGKETVEPSIGVTSSGAMFVVAGEEVLRSTDDGTTWEVVHSYAKVDGGQGVGNVPFTLDPWLWVDPVTDRIYVDHLTLACTTITWSDDDGETWAPELPNACGAPLTDFQKLVTGPPGPGANPLAGVLWPTVAYLCYNKPVFDLTGTVPAGRFGLACAASYDGGTTWQNEAQLSQRVWVAGQSIGDCAGGSWIPAVAPDGTVVVRSQPDCMFRTRDSGLTWEAVGQGPPFMGTIFDFDDNGTLYALSAWWDAPLRVSVSRDQGETWGEPYLVQPPGTYAAAFPTLQAGGRGQLFIPLWSTDEEIATSIDADDTTRWHAWLVHVADADTSAPAVRAVQATPDEAPMFVGNPTRGMSEWFLGDFVTATIGPDGAGYVVFPDACNEGCEGNANATVEDMEPLGTVVRLGVDLRGPLQAEATTRQPS